METNNKNKKSYLKKYSSILKLISENVPLLLIGLSITGGLGQFLRLITLSPHLLIYFSASQIIIEGILFFFYLIISTLIYIFHKFIYDWLKRLSTNYFVVLLLHIILIIFILSPVLIHQNLGLLCFPAFIAISFNFTNDFKKHLLKEELKSDKDKVYKYNVGAYLLVLLYVFISQLYFYSVDNFNIVNIPTEMVNKEMNNKNFKLVFVNDKYVIYKSEEEDSFYVKGLPEIIK